MDVQQLPLRTTLLVYISECNRSHFCVRESQIILTVLTASWIAQLWLSLDNFLNVHKYVSYVTDIHVRERSYADSRQVSLMTVLCFHRPPPFADIVRCSSWFGW